MKAQAVLGKAAIIGLTISIDIAKGKSSWTNTSGTLVLDKINVYIYMLPRNVCGIGVRWGKEKIRRKEGNNVSSN